MICIENIQRFSAINAKKSGCLSLRLILFQAERVAKFNQVGSEDWRVIFVSSHSWGFEAMEYFSSFYKILAAQFQEDRREKRQVLE